MGEAGRETAWLPKGVGKRDNNEHGRIPPGRRKAAAEDPEPKAPCAWGWPGVEEEGHFYSGLLAVSHSLMYLTPWALRLGWPCTDLVYPQLQRGPALDDSPCVSKFQKVGMGTGPQPSESLPIRKNLKVLEGPRDTP